MEVFILKLFVNIRLWLRYVYPNHNGMLLPKLISASQALQLNRYNNFYSRTVYSDVTKFLFV